MNYMYIYIYDYLFMSVPVICQHASTVNPSLHLPKPSNSDVPPSPVSCCATSACSVPSAVAAGPLAAFPASDLAPPRRPPG